MFFFFTTEVTQGPLLSAHYTYIKRPPNSRCVFLSGLEDTAKMTAHSGATGLPDLAGDHETGDSNLCVFVNRGKLRLLYSVVRIFLILGFGLCM